MCILILPVEVKVSLSIVSCCNSWICYFGWIKIWVTVILLGWIAIRSLGSLELKSPWLGKVFLLVTISSNLAYKCPTSVNVALYMIPSELPDLYLSKAIISLDIHLSEVYNKMWFSLPKFTDLDNFSFLCYSLTIDKSILLPGGKILQFWRLSRLFCYSRTKRMTIKGNFPE